MQRSFPTLRNFTDLLLFLCFRITAHEMPWGYYLDILKVALPSAGGLLFMHEPNSGLCSWVLWVISNGPKWRIGVHLFVLWKGSFRLVNGCFLQIIWALFGFGSWSWVFSKSVDKCRLWFEHLFGLFNDISLGGFLSFVEHGGGRSLLLHRLSSLLGWIDQRLLVSWFETHTAHGSLSLMGGFKWLIEGFFLGRWFEIGWLTQVHHTQQLFVHLIDQTLVLLVGCYRGFCCLGFSSWRSLVWRFPFMLWLFRLFQDI